MINNIDKLIDDLYTYNIDSIPIKNFADKVIVRDECWEWTKSIHVSGYGIYASKKKNRLVHRIVYSALVGPLKDKLVIDHLCRNRRCCNPKHLRQVTQKENILNKTKSNNTIRKIFKRPINRTLLELLKNFTFLTDRQKINLSRMIEKSTNKCWIWHGTKDQGGYGRYSVGKKVYKAHRFIYELLVGSIPEGLVLDHYKCYNKSCVNPDHLKPVTPKENVLNCESPVAKNSKKRYCDNGHIFDENNTKHRKDGTRYCLACSKILWTKQNEVRKEQNKLAGKSWNDRKGKRLKTHCPQGHEYNEENSLVKKNGGRECRICSTNRQKEKRITSERYKDYSLQNGRLRKKFCPNGHELTEENIYYRFDKKDKSNTRCCKQCNRERARANYLKKKCQEEKTTT